MNKKLQEWLRKQWKEYRSTILFIAFVLVPVKSALADWNWVPTGSMNPTIVEGDMVYVNKLAYDLRIPLSLKRIKSWSDPQPGDISVFLSPVDRTRLVKRVIGIPGDKIEMRNNLVYLNGEPLEYNRLDTEATEDLMENLRRHSLFAEEELKGHKHPVMVTPAIPNNRRSFQAITIPKGHYFMMGDNRDNSQDSRYFGLVKRELFLGEVNKVLVSFNILDKYQPRFNRFLKAL